MRKHLALVIEHEDEDRVGGVMFYDSPKARLTKNEPTPMRTFDKEAGEFPIVGKEVSLGYVDFEDEEAYENWPLENLHDKLREIDHEWLEKAGVAEVVRSQDTDTNQDDDSDLVTDGGVDRARWTPYGVSSSNQCLGCGAHVTPSLVRGYGTNDGRLFACLECSTPRDLRQGAGRDPDYDPETDRGRSTASGYHPIFGGGETDASR